MPHSGLVHCQSTCSPHTSALSRVFVEPFPGCLCCPLYVVSSYFANVSFKQKMFFFLSSHKVLVLSTETNRIGFEEQCSDLKWLPVLGATNTSVDVAGSPENQPCLLTSGCKVC